MKIIKTERYAQANNSMLQDISSEIDAKLMSGNYYDSMLIEFSEGKLNVKMNIGFLPFSPGQNLSEQMIMQEIGKALNFRSANINYELVQRFKLPEPLWSEQTPIFRIGEIIATSLDEVGEGIDAYFVVGFTCDVQPSPDIGWAI